MIWITREATAEKRAQHFPCETRVLSVITDDGQVVRGRESHFAYCPQAATHRKKKPVENGPDPAGAP